MKRIVLALLVLLLSGMAFADETVHGYYRRDGTYVAPYHRTAPNQYRYDNYSSQGNTNPYTGQRGTQPNEFSTPPVYNRSNPYGGSNLNTPTHPSYGSPYGQQRPRNPYGTD